MKTYARIRRLTEQRGDDIDGTFRRLADALGGSKTAATIQLTIQDGAARRCRSIDLRAKGELRLEATKAPNLEIITGEGTWREIADGSLSPLDAFVQGRLRIRGDTELGSRVLRKLSDGQDPVSICEG